MHRGGIDCEKDIMYFVRNIGIVLFGGLLRAYRQQTYAKTYTARSGRVRLAYRCAYGGFYRGTCDGYADTGGCGYANACTDGYVV